MKKMVITVGGKTISSSVSEEALEPLDESILTKFTMSKDIVLAVIGEVSKCWFDGVDHWIEIKTEEKTYTYSLLGEPPSWIKVRTRVKIDLSTGAIRPIKLKRIA